MTMQPMGAFFRTPVSSNTIINFIEKLIGPPIVSSVVNLELEGTCDSRNGGHKQLVFSSCLHYHNNADLKECFVLIDAMPEISIHSSNQFCVVQDPRATFMDVLQWLIDSVGVDAHWRGYTNEAAISNQAEISNSAFIEPGIEVGANSVISAGAIIKRGVRIGKNTIIRENAVIGCDGVTIYRAADGRLLKFPHVGGVSIGDNTEIGANTVIAGGILAPTVIGNDVIIGNLCNIGHGALIDNGVWMSVGSLVGGHTTVHAGATIAMGVTIRDNLIIGSEASLGMGSVVVKNVEPKHSMFGNPAKRMVGLKTGPAR